MLTQEFDRETMRYLSDILAEEKTTREELLRNLIRDRWLMLHQHAGIASGGQGLSSLSRELPGQAELSQAELGQAGQRQAETGPSSNLGHAEAEALPAQVALVDLQTSTHRPNSHPAKNAKQALAEFVRRRNQRVCMF